MLCRGKETREKIQIQVGHGVTALAAVALWCQSVPPYTSAVDISKQAGR